MHKIREICRWGVLVTLVASCLGFAGCTRAYYRKQADREVTDILVEKDKFPEWKIEQYHVQPDARARFADPTNPDRPPMPPDDDAAWKLSPHPQGPGHAGVGEVWGTAYLEMIKQWDAQNRAERETDAAIAKEKDTVGHKPKNPIKTYFDEPLHGEQKGFLLKLDQAIELGVINSPTYQTFREGLYLAALPVTQQRFNFSYQWAATADWIRYWAGPTSPTGFENNWTGSSTLGFSKLFATGALLSTDFVNTTVFNFVGNGFTSASTVNVNLTQPLLQGGGKAVTLEPLTQAERNLLYSIRAYARFREQFNISVALGTSPPTDLRSAIGSTSASPISVLAALGIASTDVSGGFVGYLSTLYRECDMAADKKLVQDLTRALKILEAYQEGGMYSPLQVDQVRSTLLSAQNTVLADNQFVNNALDQFKVLLGLPTNLPLILDDTPARAITTQLDQYYQVIDEADAIQLIIEKQETAPPEKLRGVLSQTFTNSPLVGGTEFAKKVPGSWAVWVKAKDNDLKDRLTKLGDERRKLFDLKTDLELKGQALSAEDAKRMQDAEFEADLGGLEQLLRRFEARPWEKLAKKEQASQDRIKLFRLVGSAAKTVLVYARNERFDAVSKSWPVLPPALLEDLDLLTADVNQAQEVAVKAALTNRMDLMNARAQVVDAWRQLKVTANALMGVATVQYNLQSQTPPDGVRPLVFTGNSTSQQIALNFQLPLNRLTQRNAYRAAQINYQIARRGLMTLEDNVASQVRFDVRQLQLFAANYRIQQKLIHSLYSQVENALEVIVAPADPDQLKASSTSGAANAAALTNQYLGALSQLNNSQVKMYDIWLSLYATRMQLYLDLERLPLDFRGVWTDDMLAPRGPVSGEVSAPRLAGPEAVAEISPNVIVPNGTAAPGRAVFLPPRVLPASVIQP